MCKTEDLLPGNAIQPVSMETMISTHSIVVAAKDQVSCDLEGEAAILNLKNGVYYGLNPVGARVWELIQEPHTVVEVRDVVLEEYDVEPDCCERDLLALLEDLAAEGLLEVKNEPDA
jgi:hypothetical protein